MTKIRKALNRGKFTPKKLSPLDTLGIVSPKSSTTHKSGIEKFKKKQLAKAITLSQLFPLIDLDSPLKKSYWSTYHCNRIILQEANKFTTSYCDQRWCTLCSRVRMAKMINGYSIPILKLDDIHFVTLTAPNVSAKNLSNEIDRFMDTWRKMYKSIKKYHKGVEMKGIRKIECTWNENTKYFNPHFHFIIQSKEAADLLVKLWLKKNPTAKLIAQDVRKADENSMIELFKYTVKGIHKGKFNAGAVDNIYQAMYYRKTYYPFGLKKIIEENIEGIKSEKITFKGERNELWKWDNDCKDWINEDGEPLTEYVIEGKLIDWIDNLTTKDHTKEEDEEPLPETQQSKWTKDIREGLGTIPADR